VNPFPILPLSHDKNQGAVAIDYLNPELTAAAARLTRRAALALASKLSKITAFRMPLSSPVATQLWDAFLPKWSAFLKKHPDIKEMCDPIYVVAYHMNLAGLANWPNPWPASPPGLPALNQTGLPPNIWNFGASVHNACVWIGHVGASMAAQGVQLMFLDTGADLRLYYY